MYYQRLPIVYDGVVLHGANNIAHVVLFCVAAGLWVLYLHEILFRSGKVQTHWVKRRLADLALMLLMALVTILIFSLVTGLQFQHRH
jgi:hypothetical protein